MSLISADDVSPRVCAAEYAVRGPIPTLASAIDAEIKQAKAEGKPSKYPFDKLIFCNIGNPQSIGQPPLTFPRQVSSLVTEPGLLTSSSLPKDAIARARAMIGSMGDTGGYSPSEGYAFVRRDIAEFITARDGEFVKTPSNPKSIFVTNGASQAVTFIMQLLIGGSTDGLMIPIPQYPLYTATLSLLNGTPVPYFLDESKGWALSAADLEAAYVKAEKEGIKTKAIVVINPGNPTGQVLDLDVMREIVSWAHKRRVLIMADEVYQQNIYAKGKRFYSFRSVVLSHRDAAVRKETQLASFHSASKGIHGECGRRGGYVELVNIPSDVSAMVAKLAAIAICPAIMGQIMMSLVVKGPQRDGESYAQYKKEYDAVYASLARRANALPKRLRQVPGITCNDIEGAMYAFPRIRLPNQFVQEAAKKKMPADALWCRGLVQEEGVVTVPGSGFGQVPGTYHFRTTILPPEDEMEAMAKRIDAYQRRLIQKYGPVEQSKL